MLDQPKSHKPQVLSLGNPDLPFREDSPTVALISMPFATLRRPSIQIGLLKARGRQLGFDVDAFHLNLDFVEGFGVPLYDILSEYRGRMLGDWVFGRAAFGEDDPDKDANFIIDFESELKPMLKTAEASFDDLLVLRNEKLPAMLDRMVEEYCWEEYDVAGFTSTFQQNAASFALALRLKKAFPKMTTLFGGANFEGDMGVELVRKVHCVDYAISGEADNAFPNFLNALAVGSDPALVGGVMSRKPNGEVFTSPSEEPFNAFDETPIPDYFDYFDRAEDLDILTGKGRRRVLVPFEGSRGCWWGAKKHCTFCGLNGKTMAFRSKSPERVEAEVNELAARHHSFDFQAVDNIMDMRLLKNMFRNQIADDIHHQFFFEVKSNLDRAQIAELSAGGLSEVQPGIESLSTPILRLMRKGVTAAQNVNMLRWSMHYGVNVNWNLLWGFPGETKQMYVDELEILKNITHLQPPVGTTRIWMERFSPIYKERETFPVSKPIEPEPSYKYIYPKSIDLQRVAYFFDYELENTLKAEDHTDIDDVVRAWIKSWAEADKEKPRPYLQHLASKSVLSIEDGRRPGKPCSWMFEKPLADIYLACSDRPVSASNVATTIGGGMALNDVKSALDMFQEKNLMLRDEERYLALSVPAVRRR